MKTSIFILEDNMTQVKTLTRYIHNYAPDIELCIASSKEEAFILLKNHHFYTKPSLFTMNKM